MNTDSIKEQARHEAATAFLTNKGWKPRGCWKFQSPVGSVHDLSAADFQQLDRIVAEGLMLA